MLACIVLGIAFALGAIFIVFKQSSKRDLHRTLRRRPPAVIEHINLNR